MTDQTPTSAAIPDTNTDTLADRMLGEPTGVRVCQQLLEHLEGEDVINTPAYIAARGRVPEFDPATTPPFGNRWDRWVTAAVVNPDSIRELCCHAIALGRAFADALAITVGHDAAIRAVQRAYAREVDHYEAQCAASARKLEEHKDWLFDRYGAEPAEERIRYGEGPVDERAEAWLLSSAAHKRAVATQSDGEPRRGGPAMSEPTVDPDDPRRHIRIRLRAAQTLVYALWAGVYPEGLTLARQTAATEFGHDAEAELLPALLRLLHDFANEPVVMTTNLRTEIARLSLYLEDIRVDGK
ncbi:MAG: hypothetical protein JWR37_401 [Mycobacterium sp.]|jgi:hypothetical protein|nr:hypothetical protein [Mycobacterium sp.]